MLGYYPILHTLHVEAGGYMTSIAAVQLRPETDRFGGLREIERRVLWLSTAIVHEANRMRPNRSGLKVGGHQASSASMVSIMTSLWFRHLRAEDRVSVKPHASPVLHAINYLLGELDESYLPTLRAFGGLQSYPSRVKDPDPVDYSTGSVGIGAPAPIWGAVARLRGMFTVAGWQVITLKYGRLLQKLFTRPGGEALRHRIDAMPNPEYQRLLRCHPDELRRRLPVGDESIARLIADLDDAAL